MSENSKKLAERFQQSKAKQATSDGAAIQRTKILDEGFLRMIQGLTESLQKQCEELNQEPQVGNILVCDLEDQSRITRTDSGATVSVMADAILHTITLRCDKPAKFNYILEVRIASDGSHWWYAGNGSGINNNLDLVAEKALAALLGVSG